MVAYRFCRTDDIPLLVDAHNACYLPHFAGQEALTIDGFKRWIRELDLWCSSCMVASEGEQLIGVMIGNKRDEQTLIHAIAVHPDWLRAGHANHMLTSLSQKLAILGPPRLVAEVPEEWDVVCSFFESAGFEREAVFTDFVPGPEMQPPEPMFSALVGPIGFDDLVSSELLVADQELCAWDRDHRTLENRRKDLVGWAFASEQQVEAFVLAGPEEGGEQRVVAFGHGPSELAPSMLELLVRHVSTQTASKIVFSKLTPNEQERWPLSRWGLVPAQRTVCMSALAISRHV